RGHDTLFGGDGSNRLDGGDGIDTAAYADAAAGVQVNLGSPYWGTASNSTRADTLISIENVTGSAFADVITGDAGANALNGGGGSDVITGGLGRDTLTGGADRDMFDFNAANETPVGAGLRDVITDFQQGLDHIDVSTIAANPTRARDQSFKSSGRKAFSARGAELHSQPFAQPGTANDITVVRGDINGEKVADFEIEISGLVKLAASDFLL